MKLLVCLDEAELSWSILPVATEFANALGAEVHLLQVIDPGAVHETRGHIATFDPRPNVDFTGGPVTVAGQSLTGPDRSAARAVVEDREPTRHGTMREAARGR